MADLPLTGGCLCGGVRYEIDAPLGEAGYCHCRRCQRRTGTAASVQAAVAAGSLRVVAGEELVREWTPPDHGFGKCFCVECGSALWSRAPGGPIGSVRLGTLDVAPELTLSYRQFVAYAAPWEAIPDDGLPRFAERRSS